MSLADDIIKRKIKQPTQIKGNVADMILNNQISQNSVTNAKNVGGIFASRVSPTGNLSTQRNIAADKLATSRQNYQNYINEQTKEARSLQVSPLSSQPTYDLSARRSQMEDLAIRNAQAQSKAKSTDKAKELKADIKQKQSEYNYANYLKNAEDVENTNYNFIDKLINPIVSGTADLLQLDRLNPEETYYYDKDGNKTYLPTKRSLKQQKIRQESTGALGVYNDVAYNMSKAVSSKLLDAVTFGGGTMLYYGDIMLDSTEEAKKQGFNNTEALAYGAGVTVLARTLDDVIGTFGGLSNASDKIPTLSQGLDRLFVKLTSNATASTILSNMGSEAISEFAEEFADNALQYVINADKSDYDSFIDMLGQTLPDALYSGLVGGISGGVGGTIENITNNTELQERKQALEDYRTTLENYKPQTIAEANYKNDELNRVDEGINQIEQRQEEIQQKQEAKSEESASKEETTSEVASKEETTKKEITIKESTEPKKKGQLQFDIKEDTVKQNIKSKGEKLNLSPKEITYKQSQAESLKNNLSTKDTTMAKAIETGNVIQTKDGGLKKTFNERETEQVMKFVNPTDKKVSVKTTDINGNTVSMTKPSADFLKDVNNNDELIDKLENNKTSSQKAQDRRDALKLEQTYERRRNTIKDDTRMTEYQKTEFDHMFKALSLDNLEQHWADKLTEDFDAVDEEFRTSVLNNNITPDTIAQASVLAKYYQHQGDWIQADYYYQQASTALHNPAQTVATAKLLYQDNPMGAYSAYMKAVEETYKNDARYHKNDIEWHKKNDLFNPDGSINHDSPYRLSDDVKNDLGAKIKEWYQIEDSTSKAAKIKQKEINTLLKNNLPNKPMIERITDFRRSAMLNSVGIWIKNSRQELIDVSNAVITDIGSSPSDIWLSKLRNKIENEVRQQQGEELSQKRYRTTSISTTSAKEFVSGYKNGAKNHWESIKNDVVLNRFNSRYSDATVNQTTNRVEDINNIDRRSENAVQVFMDKINAVGMAADTRFAEAYFAQSLYDQQSQFALNMASDTGKTAVVRTEVDNSGAKITYVDPDTLTIQNEIIPKITTKEGVLEYLEKNEYVMPTEKDINTMFERASQLGSYRTMQDSGPFTRFTANLIKNIDNFTIEHLGFPLGSTIAPFYRASTESIRTFVKSTPLAAISINNKINQYKQAVRESATGVNTNNNLFDMQYSLAKDMGQAIGGTMAMIIGTVVVKALASKGVIVGNNPDDKKGEEEYSIKIGDKSYSFNIDTVTTTGLKFMSVLSDEKNISKKETNSIIKNIEKTFSNFGSPLLDTVLEQTALSAFAEYTESKYGTTWDNIWYQVSRVPGSFVPTISKNLASIFDGFTSRDTSSDTLFGKMVNSIGSKIPFVRSYYNEKKDEWNSTENASLNILEKAWNSLVNNEISISKTTPVDKELYNLYLTTGSTKLFPSTGLDNTFTRGKGDNKATYVLTDSERKKYQNTYGQIAFDTLEKLMNTSVYKNANDKDKATMVQAVYTYAKTQSQNRYLDTKEVYYENEETAIEKVINQNISYTSAQYQKSNPDRWKLYTSIIDDYDDYKSVSTKIKEIESTYSSANGFNYTTRRNKVAEYVNQLSMNVVKKAMLIKISGYQNSYASFDDRIVEYLNTLNLTEEQYNYFVKASNLGLDGYYTTIYRSK